MSINRRNFIKTTAVVTAAFSLGLNLKNSFSIIIKNGTIADGTGAPLFKADLGINRDKIEFIGDLSNATADFIIDAKNKIVSPGFIDIHTHTDTHLLINPSADSKLRQGVTTEIGGNCGGSAFPLDEEDFADYAVSLKERHSIDTPWRSMNEFYSLLEKRKIALNFASFVGNGNIRAIAVGRNDIRPTKDQLNKMKNVLEEHLQNGCMGLSSGLEYAPSSYADKVELTELCKIVSKYDAIYNTHMRNEDDTIEEAISEAIEICSKANCSLEIAHLKTGNPANWHKIDSIFEMISNSAKSGLRINADRYPYIAYSTGLGNFIPIGIRQGSTDEILARLKDKELIPSIRKYTESRGERIGGWQNVVFSGIRGEEYQNCIGKSVKECATERVLDPFDFITQILIAEKMNISIVGFAMSEDNLKRILSHDLIMIGSDGSAVTPFGKLGEGRPHPRAYGSNVRVLGKYCREEKLFGWETAVKKMTSMPAQKLKIRNRGILQRNYYADVVVFNPDTVIDKATFADPHQFPEGIEHVLVNGVHTIKDGQYINALAGRVLRKV
ncbi:MAG: D-aminoacylase [Ignavibacteriales bacterium]|nr:D-aminoacylase [Ignavibacteriales bacterium]